MITKTVKAKKVREGDFIPGLDNAYVPWEPEEVDEWNIRILLHDANGNEVTLECDKQMPITIDRRGE